MELSRDTSFILGFYKPMIIIEPDNQSIGKMSPLTNILKHTQLKKQRDLTQFKKFNNLVTQKNMSSVSASSITANC